MLALLLIGLFVGGVIIAAFCDVRSMLIPNWISIAYLVVFPLAAWAAGLGWREFGLHYLAGLIGLFVCFALFALNIFGGGDAKLLPAVLVWIGPAAWLEYVYGIALVGGLLAGLILISRRFVPQTAIPGFLHRSVVVGPGIPYAIAIGIGAIWAMPASPLLQTLISQTGFGH